LSLRRVLVSTAIWLAVLSFLPGAASAAVPRGFTVPRGIPVLMYHHLAPKEIASKARHAVVVTPEVFEAQMSYLKRNGYTAITTRDLASHLLDGGSLPARPVLITLDDGYESNYVYVFPLLKKYNMKATIFAITGMITDERRQFNPAVATHLTWAQVSEMAGSGLVEFASHSANLHFVDAKRRYGMDAVTPASLEQDLRESARAIKEKTGIQPVAFAYPYGYYRKAYKEAIQRVGFRVAFTIHEGEVRKGDNPMELNRITIYPYHTDLDRVLRARTCRFLPF